MEVHDGPDGQTLYVNRDLPEKGSKGPFFVTFSDSDGDARWGFYCDNCDTCNNAMDAMGRIQCNVCSNVRKPEEWDAAHE